MILVIGQNSVWQNTYLLPDIKPGKVNRVTGMLKSAAGKGANLTRGLRMLGKPAHLLAYAGGAFGEHFCGACEAEKLEKTVIGIAAETRMCTTILQDGGNATEIVELAPKITATERQRYHDALQRLLPKAKVLAIAGTAVHGESDDCYLRFALKAKAMGVPVFVDSYRAHGKMSLQAKPEILKINSDELANLTGLPADSHKKRELACGQIRKQFGVKWVIITTGSNGAEGFSDTADVIAAAPDIKVVNPIGSGDVFSSGIISGLLDCNMSWDVDCLEHAIRLATAMGTANCFALKTGHVEESDLHSVLSRIEVRRHK